MRILVLALILGIPTSALAGDEPRAYAPISAGISVMARDDHGGGSETTSAGLNVELALGSGRFQYFVEGATAWLQDDHASGNELRGGLGVRWLARSFEFYDVGAFEMHVEGVSGLTRLSPESAPRRVYPDVGLGLGFAVRVIEPTRLCLRMTARVVFAQTDRDTMMACRGECSQPSSVPGFVALFGFVW